MREKLRRKIRTEVKTAMSCLMSVTSIVEWKKIKSLLLSEVISLKNRFQGCVTKEAMDFANTT